MGRAERRRIEKEKGKAQKVYTLTQAQIDAMKKAAVDEAVSTGFILMLAIPMECHTNLECMKMLFTTLIGITDGKVKQSAFVHFVAVLSQMRLGQS